jgi:uncharacterized membrane protein YkvA (DUF1232 family)
MGRIIALKNLMKTGRLALRLLRDPRVPLYAKVVPLLGILYALSPLDFLPDLFPVLGQLDDLAILAAALQIFLKLCPDDLVAEHEAAVGKRPGGRVIEGTARAVESRQ